MAVQDSYKILMDVGDVLYGAQKTSAAILTAEKAFSQLSDVINKYNSKGRLTGQVFKGIGLEGENLSLTLEKVKGKWTLVGGAASTAARDIQRAKEAMKAAEAAAQGRSATRGIASGQAAVSIVSKTPLPKNGSADEILAYNRALASLQKFTQENVTSAARVQKVWTDVNNNIFSANPKYQALQNQLVKVKQAINNVGEAARKAKESSDNYFLSWRNIMRFFEARLLYNAISDLGGAFRSGIERAIEFEQVLGRITTLAPALAGGYKEWGESVKRVATTFGVDATDAAKSYYSALSNQIGNSIVEIEAFTRTTAEFARVTGSSAEQANNLFSSAINAFGKSAGDANDIAAKFFKTIDLGRVTAAGLSGSFGRTAVAASTLGVKYEELLASLSTLSRQGVTDADAQTQTLNLFNKLIKPTEKLKEMLTEWGYESGQALIKNEGLIGVLRRLDEELQSKGVARLGELINDIRGLRGTFGLTGKGLQEFASDLDKISNSQADYNKAVEQTAQTLGFKLAKELNAVKVAFTGLGQDALGALVPISEFVGGLVNGIKLLIGSFITLGTAVYGLRVLQGTLSFITAQWAAMRVAATAAGAASATAGAIATGGLSLIAGAVASYFLLAESKADAFQRGYNEALEAMDESTKRSLADTTKRFEKMAVDLKASFKPVFDFLRDLRASFSATVKAIDAEFDEYKDNIRELSTDVFKGLDESISKITSRISELKSESKSLSDDINKAFRVEAIDEFNEGIEELSNGKKVKAIEAQIKALIAKSKEYAQQSLTADSEEEALSLYNLSQQQIKIATSLATELKATGKAAIKEKIAAQKELDKLTKKDTEAAQKELDLKRKIATFRNEAAANAKRPGSRDNANAQQELVSSQIKRAQQELLELEKERAEAREKLAVIERDTKGLDVLRTMTDLHKQMTEAVLEQEAASARMLADNEERKKQLEAQKAPIKKVIDNALELLSSDDKDLTEEAVKNKVSSLIASFRVAAKEISDITGESIDYSAIERLTDITAKIEARAKAKGGEAKVDDLRLKAEGELNKALKQQADLEAKIKSKDTSRTDSVAKLAGEIESLSNISVPNFFGFNTDIINPIAAKYNTLAERLRAIKEELKADPASVAGLSNELLDISNQFSALSEAGNANNGLKSATRTRIEELNKAIRTAVESNRQLEDARLAINELLGLQATLRQSMTELGVATNNSALAQGNLNAQLADSIAKFKELQLLAQSTATAAPQPAQKAGGGLMHFAGGGRPYGSDKIPSLLSPGEFVVNAGASRKFYSQLVAMNSGSRNYAGGGSVNTNVGDVNIHMSSSGNAATDVVRIGKLLRREIRRGTVKL